MRIAIIGYGNMGKEVEKAAISEGVEVASIIDPATGSKRIDSASMKGVDVAIDFSSAKSELENIEAVSKLGKSIVVGTTGWYDNLQEARSIVEKNGTGLIYSPNFSVGTNLFVRIVEHAAQLMDKMPSYDPFVFESHHNQKVDAPGGTARLLADTLIKNIKRKRKLAFDRVERRILPDELHVVSLRAGWMPGTHIVGFDSKADTIELKHTARSRMDFALGAIRAAHWISGRKGIYTMAELMEDVMAGKA
jgi:4-hydroxy-tetrahydrodipicolinate reductase